MNRPRSARRRIERALFPMLVRRCLRAASRRDDENAAVLERAVEVLQECWGAQVEDLAVPERIEVLQRMQRLEVRLMQPMVHREVTLPFYALHKLMQRLIDEDAFDPRFDPPFQREYDRVCRTILDEPENVASLEEYEAEAEAQAQRMRKVLRAAGLYEETWHEGRGD